jgi:hypothetical protein
MEDGPKSVEEPYMKTSIVKLIEAGIFLEEDGDGAYTIHDDYHVEVGPRRFPVEGLELLEEINMLTVYNWKIECMQVDEVDPNAEYLWTIYKKIDELPLS